MKLHFGRENQAEEAKGREVFQFRLEGDDAAILEEVAARIEPMILRTAGVLGIRRGEDPPRARWRWWWIATARRPAP